MRFKDRLINLPTLYNVIDRAESAEIMQIDRELQQALEEFQTLQEELRQQNEELLVARELVELERQRYQDLFEFVPDGYLVTDAAGIIQEANRAAATLLAMPQEYLVNKPLIQFVDRKDWEIFSTLLNNLQSVQEWEISLRPPKNKSFLASIKTAAIYNSLGELVGRRWLVCNINERQQVKEALHQSEEKFRNFAENTEAAIWIASPDSFHPLYMSPAYEKIWGRCCENLYDRSEFWIDTVHPDDRSRFTNFIEQLLNNQSASAEYRILRLDGSWRWIWNRGFPVYDRQGKIDYYGGIAEDITDRKLAEESLRENQARLSLALETAQMGIWDRNFTDDIVIWSPGMGLLYGLPAGSSFPGFEEYFNLVHPEDRESVLASMNRAVKEGGGTEEYRVVWPDASIHWLHCTSRFYYNEKQEPIRAIGTNRNITNRKLNEQKISEQAALLDIATDAIFVRDFDSQILLWNKGAERMYGWLCAEVIQKDYRKILFAAGTHQQLEMPLKKAIESGSWQGELNKVTKSGKKIVVESRWTLMHDAKGKPKSILCVDTDITEKKQLQEQFFRTQRLESIGTLAGGIAHDLNNILTPILAAAQLLQDKYFQEEERFEQLIALIESNAKRGATLVKQVLSFARGFKGERTSIEVGHLITEIIQIAKQTFPKSIEFYTAISEEILAVNGNSTQLHQVLMNLIVNARDALPNGGNIQISATNKFIDETYAKMNLDAKVGNYIVITVTDNGIGIPSQILDKIFEPFFTTKEVNIGTGLGLSTALGIIKSHGGFIKVSSQVDKGSKFKIFLPAVESTPVLNIEESEAYPGQGELILVVDDEAQIRDIAKVILEKHNYKMLAASNGIEAIALYAQYKHEIKAVLMDLMMPEMDGITAIRTLRKMSDRVQIIACSGLNSREVWNQANDANVQVVLSKPYTARELLKSLHQVLH
ncbi:MAG: PAS domain S-box protein [Nostoc sp. ChiSLP02]|nr:PAS domain S-box protein [Nostoc sp. DedSLP05]MDZ8098108.1 PAS domain S-box protein [Nostoc sp. DedSLP01]MDZ8188550.1 PAS domain S-box protein [Nostoc sp. ChiSLP02]